MSANGISRLTFKRQRQEAKLTLAATRRVASDRRSFLDLSQLPTLYAPDSNDTNMVVNNPNVDGYVVVRRQLTPDERASLHQYFLGRLP